MSAKRQHYVVFMSPGTFSSEVSERPIGEWNTHEGARIAAEIKERHGAIPYSFQFETRLIHDPIPDGEGGTLTVNSRTVDRSGTYFIKGETRRYDDIPDNKETHILRSNMRCNDWPIVVETRNGYRHTTPFGAHDAIVDADGTIIVRGDAPEHVEYRAKMTAGWNAERT